MTEQEKRDEIIKMLAILRTWVAVNPKYGKGLDVEDCVAALPWLDEAIEALKQQEPVEPTIGGDATGQCRNWWYQCGICKEAIDYHDKYCRTCGQAVNWQ